MTVQDLGDFVDGRVFPFGSWCTSQGDRVCSATSIGTEENSLRVPKVRDRALIYRSKSQHEQRVNLQVQRNMSLLGK